MIYIMNMAKSLPPDAGADGVSWHFPSIHPEGAKFLVGAALLTILLMFTGPTWLAWPMVGLSIWLAMFFRDPRRMVPQGDALIIAPADGLVTLIKSVVPPNELYGEAALGNGALCRISIFMSVFDVHINRSPIAGTVRQICYIEGGFQNADLDSASEDNERQHFLVERADGLRIGFTQIAGLVARRILAFVKQGDEMTAGQRVGMIRFGSRVDVYLPANAVPAVALGQRCIAGETIIGILPHLQSVALPAVGLGQ